MTPNERRAQFFDLHHSEDVFVMPNPWDIGSAKLFAAAGFPALATTSAGLAWALGKDDQQLTLDELLAHVEQLVAATDLPLNVDSERCYADDLDGIGVTIGLLHDAGAAGCSIEDYDPATESIDDVELAAERVAAAAEAAHRSGDPIVLTARCENFLYGRTDLDDTIDRLVAYRDAGADCLYAPGLSDVDQIRAVAEAVATPINVLALPGGPSVAEIGAAGGQRVSTGSSLASTAYGAAMVGAHELLDTGTSTYLATRLQPDDRRALG